MTKNLLIWEVSETSKFIARGSLLHFFFFFWLPWVFVFGSWLSLVAARRVYSSFWHTGFPLLWLLLLQSTGCRCTSFSSCGMGLVAPWHVEFSLIEDWTGVPCIGNGFLSTGPPGKSFSKHFWWRNHYQNKIDTLQPQHIFITCDLYTNIDMVMNDKTD